MKAQHSEETLGPSSSYARLTKLRDEANDEIIAELLAELAEMMKGNPSIDDAFIRSRHPEYADILISYLPTLNLVAKLSTNDHAGTHDSLKHDFNAHELEDYELLGLLGYGGMGVVYEARQKSVSRRVALKLLPLHEAKDERQRQRFENEIRAISRLQHPNIVPIYAVGESNGQLFYSMQYVDGCTFSKIARTKREATSSINAQPELEILQPGIASYQKLVIKAFIDLADALEHAHQMGIVHRDIKPSNLMLDRSGNPWLLDFGLALIDADSSLTLSGEFVGTLRYMSPEQVKAEGAVTDERSDIYSLGASLYEMVTRRIPFEDSSKLQLLRHIREQTPVAPRKLDPTIHRDLEKIIVKSMSKDPRDRYVSAGAFRDDLQRFASGVPVNARPLSSLQRLGRQIERHPIGFLVAFSIMMLLSGSVASAVLYGIESRSQKRINELLNESVSSMETKVKNAKFIDVLSRMRERRDRAANGWVWENLNDAKIGVQFCDDETSKLRLRNELIQSLIAFDMRPSVRVLEKRDIYVAKWSPDGKLIAVGMNTPEENLGIVEIIDGQSKTVVKTLKIPIYAKDDGQIAFEGVRSLLFSGDGQFLLCGTRSGRLCVFRLEDWEMIYCEAIHSDYLLSLCWFINEGKLCTGSKDGELKLFEFPSMRVIHEVSLESQVKNIVYMAGRIIVSADGTHCYEFIDGRFREVFNEINTIGNASIGRSSDQYAVSAINEVEMVFHHAICFQQVRRFDFPNSVIGIGAGKTGLDQAMGSPYQFGWMGNLFFAWDNSSGSLVKSFSASGQSAVGIASHPSENRGLVWFDNHLEEFEFRENAFCPRSPPKQSIMRDFDLSPDGEILSKVYYDLAPIDSGSLDIRAIQTGPRSSLDLHYFSICQVNISDVVCVSRDGMRTAHQGRNHELALTDSKMTVVLPANAEQFDHLVRCDSSDLLIASGERKLPSTGKGGSNSQPVLECFSFLDDSKKWEWVHPDFPTTRTPSTFTCLAVGSNAVWGGCRDQTIRVFDLDNGEQQKEFSVSNGTQPPCIQSRMGLHVW